MANLDTLLAIGETSTKIAELEAEAEELRFKRAADMAKARKEGATLEQIGSASDMTHPAVRKAIEQLGPGSDRAKAHKKKAVNAARRARYSANKPTTEAEVEARREFFRDRYQSQKAGQSIRQG